VAPKFIGWAVPSPLVFSPTPSFLSLLWRPYWMPVFVATYKYYINILVDE
jgi:hypothetical protein